MIVSEWKYTDEIVREIEYNEDFLEPDWDELVSLKFTWCSNLNFVSGKSLSIFEKYANRLSANENIFRELMKPIGFSIDEKVQQYSFDIDNNIGDEILVYSDSDLVGKIIIKDFKNNN